jgi:protein phosphatase
VLLLAFIALCAAALGGTYAWAQTQYYVGVADDHVAVYRGVNAAVGPLKFNRVAERTTLKVSDLNPSVQSQVRSGIPANNRTDADRIVRRLHDEQKPVCRPVAATSSTPSTTGGATGTRSSTAHGSASRTASATANARTTGRVSRPARPASVLRSATRAATTASARHSATPSTAAAPTSTPSAGTPASSTGGGASTDCRKTS